MLYGSNAIGGVVNAIDGHESPHKGVNGYLTTLGSTNSWQAGGSAGIEAGTDKLLFWANGGAQKANNYLTPPIGRIINCMREVATSAPDSVFIPVVVFSAPTTILTSAAMAFLSIRQIQTLKRSI